MERYHIYTFTVSISNWVHNFKNTLLQGTCEFAEGVETILIYCHLYLIWSIVIPIQNVNLNSDPWLFSPQTLLLRIMLLKNPVLKT